MNNKLPRVIEKGLLFKEKIRRKERLNGAWVTLGSTDITYLMARAGLDYVLLDLEHGAGGIDSVRAQVQAILSLDCAVMVRLPDHTAGAIKRILDAGANIILAPAVDTMDQANNILEAALFSPLGARGVAVGAIAASDFGYMPDVYYEEANNALTCICQVETPLAIENLEEMATIEHIDGFFIGPNDLSASMRRFRKYDDPAFVAAVTEIETKTIAAGKIMGCLPYPGSDRFDLHARGHLLAPSGSDQSFIRDGASHLVTAEV